MLDRAYRFTPLKLVVKFVSCLLLKQNILAVLAGPAIIYVIQYFRSLCSSISFSVALCSFSQKRLVLFAQMWLCSHLKQWPNHVSLLFSRKVSTGFICASFLVSSFLMWSNLIFLLAHLNILISVECCLV